MKVWGQASDIMIRAQEIIRMKQVLSGLYTKHTGQAPEVVERTLDRDTFMSSQEAQQWGLIDEIIEKRADAPAAETA
ncbi:ATP-dependent Clp protease proteolytic subunit [Haematococcus lacustris]|uniref:ATP-dependent Clp protease proteolytic subunit n=1 Tax=Haematococcus lacustris TaxID=44745 RepID=A0A699Z2D7_HAELA|nr:ATP-dependent Clp protease proteolytic subunit [Haematococcus lacustris]